MTQDEKNSAMRILRVLVPFIIMVAAQKLLAIIFGGIMSPDGAGLLSFVFAAGVGIVFFRFRGTFFASSDGDDAEAGLAGLLEIAKGRARKGGTISALHTLFAFALMSASMYFITVMFGAEGDVPTVGFLSVLSLLVVHPILEEYIFRKMFYSELRVLNPIFGILVQAVMFAIIHGSVSSMMYALISGIILGSLSEVTGSLIYPITAHFALNLRSVLYLRFLSDRVELQSGLDIALIVLGVAAAAILVVIGLRCNRER